MFYFVEKKKKTNVWKIIAIVAAVAAGVAAAVAVFMIWKKKIGAQKQIEQEIEAIIEDKFAEEEIIVELGEDENENLCS